MGKELWRVCKIFSVEREFQLMCSSTVNGARTALLTHNNTNFIVVDCLRLRRDYSACMRLSENLRGTIYS